MNFKRSGIRVKSPRLLCIRNFSLRIDVKPNIITLETLLYSCKIIARSAGSTSNFSCQLCFTLADNCVT
jgi:hypothetical protein